jgi:hypothetical protein
VTRDLLPCNVSPMSQDSVGRMPKPIIKPDASGPSSVLVAVALSPPIDVFVRS